MAVKKHQHSGSHTKNCRNGQFDVIPNGSDTLPSQGQTEYMEEDGRYRYPNQNKGRGTEILWHHTFGYYIGGAVDNGNNQKRKMDF